MKGIKISIYFITIILVICACSKKQTISTIAANLHSEKKISAIVSGNYDIITLKSDTNHFIGKVDKMLIHKNEYFILDKQFSKKIHRFDKNGELINTIGKIGDANGEYQNPSTFLISDGKIEIFDSDNFKKLDYSLDGNFLEEQKIAYWVKEVFEFNDLERIVFSPTDFSLNGKENLKSVISIMDSSYSKISESYFSYQEVLDDAPFPGLLNVGYNRFVYTKPLLNEIYEIGESGRLESIFKIDFGRYNWPISADQIQNDQSKSEELFSNGMIMSIVHNLLDSKDYLTFNVIKAENSGLNDEKDTWWCVYNKRTEELDCYHTLIDEVNGLKIKNPVYTEDEYFYSTVDVESILDTSSGESIVLDSLKRNLNYLSSPVIIKYRLK